MKKLIFAIVVTFAILSFSIALFFFWTQSKRDNPSEAIQAVPTDASFILKINDFHRFSGNLLVNSHLWKILKPFTSISRADSTIAFIDTLTSRSTIFNQLLAVNPVYISLHVQGVNNLELLATAKIPPQMSKKDICREVEQFTKNHYKIIEREYNDITISTIVDSSHSKELFSFAIFRGIVICSATTNLVKSSILQLASHTSLTNNPSFLSISHTAGTKVDANLYINNEKIPATFSHFFKQPYCSGITTFADIALWSELDITVKDDALFLNGFSHAADSSNTYLKVFARQHPVENKLASILPAETAVFICLGISDLDLFLEDYRLYLDSNDRILEYTAALTDCKKSIGVDIHELYRSFFSKEIALFFSPFDGVDPKDCWYVAVRTNGQSQAKQTFNDLIESYIKENKLKRSDFKTSFKVDSEKSFDIYRFPIKGINKTLFGSLFSEVSDEYFTFIDNYIIFGASTDALSKIILSNIHNKQLQLDVSYRQFGNVLAAESNYFFYLNPYRAEK